MIKTTIIFNNQDYHINLANPIDISIPVGRSESPNAFYLPQPQFSTVEAGGFVGDVHRGGSCNVENISFSPHGNGTHTECIGHIGTEHTLVNNLLKRSFFLAWVVTVITESNEEGSFISRDSIEKVLSLDNFHAEALIIRTEPNPGEKRTLVYGGTNPAYIKPDAMELINSLGVRHLLTDLPSVDKEDDNELKAHHLFFGHQNTAEAPKTITEMIYVDNNVADGFYWLDLQISGFESDAAPSRPVLYRVL